MRSIAIAATALLALTAGAAAAQQAQIGIAPVTLGSEPYVFDTAEQHKIKVSVLAKNLPRPFAIEFLPNGDLLVSERGGALSVIKSATSGTGQVPAAIPGMPKPATGSFSVGVQDIALHPDFADNRWIYFTYNDPAPRPANSPAPEIYTFCKFKVMRGKLENGQVTGVQTLLEGDVGNALGSRLAFGKDGMLYVTTGAAFGDAAQDLGSIYGKVLRIFPDGAIPKDNPFTSVPGANPAVYSYGHRDQHGLAIHPETGQVLAAEHGPSGGDEVNVIKPGANYGWPKVSFGRNYDGAIISAAPTAEGIESPLLVWLPSIGPSGLMVYTGDRFPAWKGNLFVGSARWGEIPFTGSLQRVVFGANLGELRREALLSELHQRVRDFAQGPDGNIYVLTDGNENAVLRIEPVAP